MSLPLKHIFFLLLVVLLLGFTYFKYRHRSFLRINEDHTWLLSHRGLGDDPVNLSEEIPLLIHQTYFSKEKVPEKVRQNISNFAPEFKREFYDDSSIKNFLLEYFDGKVLDAFNNLKLGAHKADLFRYAVLYIKGGVYLDIKTQLIQPLKPLLKTNTISTVISRKPKEIYQGIIITPPRQPIFLALMAAILQSGPSPPYNLFILDFMKYILADTFSSSMKEGGQPGKHHTYFLYKEICSRSAKHCEDGLDRYGLCCNVFSGEKRIIKTRYSDYPW